MIRKKTIDTLPPQSDLPLSLAHRPREREIANLRTLQRLSQEITASLNFDEVCNAIYRGTSELMSCDAFFIALYDERAQALNFVTRFEQGIVLPSVQIKLDEGLASTVVKTHETINISDAEHQTRFNIKHWRMGPPAQSLIAVPMLLRDRILGVLSAQSYQLSAYDEIDMQILMNFATQAAIAIQNAQLFAQSQHKMKQFSVLNEVGRIVSSTIEIDRLLELLYDQVRRVLKADSYHVSLYDAERRMLRYEVVVDEGERFPAFERPIGTGFTSLVIQRRAPLRVNMASVESERMGVGRSTVGKAKLSESWLGVPLVTSGHLLGVLTVASYEPNMFDESDQEILQNVANQAATAIQNAHLFAESQRKMKQLTVLNEIGRIVTSTIEIDRLLELIYEQVNRTIPADTYFVTLADFERHVRTIVLLMDEGERYPPKEIPLEDGLGGVVIKRQAPLLVRNLEQEAAHIGVQGVQVGKPHSSQSWLGVPMMSAGHLLGTLAVASYHPTAFDESDMEVLQNVANQAAIAIDNARHHAEVEDQARRDSLTQVLNHGSFVRSLQDEIKRAGENQRQIALIMLDVDHFKIYNDRYGHLAGDAILRGTVQAIRENVKQADLIGRWGGEEFAIALLESDAHVACEVAERIQRVLPQRELKDDQGRAVPAPTVSQGIAVFPQDAGAAFQLVDVADRRLYVAKKRGRDQIQSED